MTAIAEQLRPSPRCDHCGRPAGGGQVRMRVVTMGWVFGTASLGREETRYICPECGDDLYRWWKTKPEAGSRG